MTTHILAHARADLADYCRKKHVGQQHFKWITAASDLRGEQRGKLVVLPSAWDMPEVRMVIIMAVMRGFDVKEAA